MDWSGLLSEILWGSLSMLRKLALILFPLLIGVEIVDETGLLDRFSKLFNPILKCFNLPKDASLPLIVAQIFGLTYGAGVIIRIVDEDKLNSEQLMTLAVFLVICHAVIEDTLLFVAIGGNGAIMLGTRVILALLLTYLYSRYIGRNEEIKVEGLADIDCC